MMPCVLTLDRLLRAGAALTWADGALVLAQPGREIARAPTLGDLMLLLGSEIPRRPWLPVRMSKEMMVRLRDVLDRGESIGAFIRLAIRAEIARRAAVDRAALAPVECAEVQP